MTHALTHERASSSYTKKHYFLAFAFFLAGAFFTFAFLAAFFLGAAFLATVFFLATLAGISFPFSFAATPVR